MPKEKIPMYGGQALMEGVLMRGSKSLAAAMRAPDGSIVIKTEELSGIYVSPIKKIPFLRGLILLWDAMVLGTRFLVDSANIQSGEDEKIEGGALYLTVGLSLVIGMAGFFLLPAAAAQGLEKWLHWSAWWSNLFEGVLRLVLMIIYLWTIGQSKDIARFFMYHGAEHKTINAFEAGAELKPEIVTRYSLEHPRCGTSFLLSVILISIVLFTLLGPLPFAWRLISRIVLLPLIAGIAYEYIRWVADHLDSAFIRFLIIPNLALQKLTTREPSLEMLEVAIASFNQMYSMEKVQATP